MYIGNPINRLARALLLATVGFLLAVGAAAAHERHGASNSDQARATTYRTGPDTHASDHTQSEAVRWSDLSLQAGRGEQGSVPCSEDDAAGHLSGDCCTIACHAALAAASVMPVGVSELPYHRIVSLTDMLVGRSTDRAERPPKAS